MPISLVLDIIISVLLVLTIAYAVRLNQRLSQLRSDKNELLQLAKTFADATIRAEAGIQQLRISNDALRDDMKKAEALKEDLSYLVERGGRSADEMVASVRGQDRGQDRDQDRAPDSQRDRASMRAASSGQRSSGQRSSGQSRGQDRDTHADPEARLIEDAIRAATPQGEEQERDQGPRGARRTSGDNNGAAMTTRRITGHAASTSQQPDRKPGALATRGIGQGLGMSGAESDDDAIENTQAARELLKALSAVK